MGTTLENGVYLPSEGERNCYAGLKTNWEILDQKVADVTALQQAVAGALHREIVESLPTTDIDPNTIYMVLSGTSATENVYNEYMYVNNAWELIGTSATDLTNYYTKGDVDGLLLLKANASDLTSHTGDTTIHVTTADKNRWNNNTYVFRYSSTALVASSTNSNTLLDNTDNLKVGDKVIDSSGVLFSITAIDTANSTFSIGTALIDLALDANVMHLSGNEDVNGTKTFKDMIPIDGDYLGNETSTNQRTNICLRSNRDTAGKSCAYITRFRQNRAQGALQTGDLQMIGFDVLENEVRTNNVLSIQCTDWLNDVPQRINIICGAQSYSFGNSARKALFNDLNPGSLSMPDLNNGLDISGYITLGSSDNTYTPPVDGWICIYGYGNACALRQNNLYATGQYISESGTSNRLTGCTLCVKGGVAVDILLRTVTSLSAAYFYPCQGNV